MEEVVCAALGCAQASRIARAAWARGSRAATMVSLVRAAFWISGLCAGGEGIVARDLVYMKSSCCVDSAPSEPFILPELVPTRIISW
jgi:hypothetical protein